MFDYQRIVDDVRGALATAGVETIDAIRLAAADYSAACDEVNARLRQCGELLRKGLRSEAIQLAELEPNLLDTVSTLDFPDWDQWRQVTGRFGIAPPVPLQLDVAAELNEAYALEEPLTLLLRRQRLLALARSPLPLRISVLRQLAEADPQNPVWCEDLRVFEQERQRQLQSEVAEAARATDLERLNALYHELHESPWLELPPPTLVHWVESMCDDHVRQENRANLVAVTAQLEDALANSDVKLARQVRDAWQALAESIELDEMDELRQRAKPALEWLAGVDEHDALHAQIDASLLALEQALDRNAPSMTLKQLHVIAIRDATQIPEELELRYRRQLKAERNAALRRWGVLAGRVAVVITLVGGAAGYAVRQSAWQAQVDTATETLSKLIDEQKFDEAKAYLDSLKRDANGVDTSEEISALSVKLEEVLKQEQHRHDSFVQSLEKAKRAGSEKPDYESLTQAERLAKGEDEKKRLVEFHAEVNAVQQEMQRVAEAAFLKDLQPIAATVDALEQGSADSAKALLSSVMQIRKDCTQIGRRHAEAGNLVKVEMKQLWDRLAALQERSALLEDEEVLLNGLQQARGIPKQHRDLLAGYVERFGDTPRGVDFKLVVGEAHLWDGVACWNEVSRHFEGDTLLKLDSTTAFSQMEVLQRAFAQHGGFPLAAAFRQRLPHLEAVAARRGEGKWIADRLDTLFHDRLLDRVWMIEMTNGKRFYLDKKPEIESSVLANITYIADFDLSKKTTTIQVKDVALNDRAPQVAVSETVSKALQELNDDNWEPTFLHIIATIQKATSIEPLLKLSLLQQTIEIGSRGSAALAKAYEQHLAEMKSANIAPFANWLDPQDAKTAEARDEARLVLERLADRPIDKEQILAESKAARGPIGKHYTWCGHLLRGPKRDWTCQLPDDPPEEGELYIVRPGMDATQVVVDRIGAIKAGVPQLDFRTLDSPSFVEGRPIFVLSQQTAKAR